MSTGALSQGLGREADNSPPFSIEVENGGVIPPLPISLHVVALNVLNTGTTLPFYLMQLQMLYENKTISITLEFVPGVCSDLQGNGPIRHIETCPAFFF
jgi:hypothetical protein